MDHDSHELDRGLAVSRVLWIEAGANVVALASKLAVGLATGATVLIADAVHSGADLANNGLALVSARLSREPPDSGHPFGHAKFEPLAVFALAIALAVLAVEVALRAVSGSRGPVEANGYGLAAMIVILFLQLIVGVWESGRARALHSDLLRADARHTLSDVGTTLAAIAGWQLAAAGYAWLDRFLSLAIAALIVALAYGLFRRAIPPLVDGAVGDSEELARAVDAVPGVRETRRVRASAGGAGPRVDVVVAVDASLSTADSHAIADRIEQLVQAELGARDVTVHVEPLHGTIAAGEGSRGSGNA